jgi:2-iminobutanoate/2-iminopropanoate deaminase
MKTSLLVVAASLLAGQAVADDRQVFAPNPVNPPPPYSPGVKANNIVYVAGQVAPEAGADLRAQAEAVLTKVKAVVEAAGSTMPQVDKCGVFLLNAADFEPMNEIWRKFFPSNPPARTTVVVAALPRPSALIEIDCTAH